MDARARTQSGFTLIELLVVIAVLGTLSGVAVVTTGTLRDRAKSTMCATDEDTLTTAQEAAFVQTGAYLDEKELVAQGYLKRAAEGIDVVLTDGGFQLVAVGECAGGGEELADGPSEEEQAKLDEQAKAEEQAKLDEQAKAEEQAKLDEQAKAEEQAKLDEQAKAEERAKREAEERAKEAEQADAAEQPSKPKGCEKGQIDINSASKKQLREIKHVGGDEASRIEKQRPFKSVEQLVEVKGLDEGDVKDITEQGLACVGAPSSSGSGEPTRPRGRV
jgi:prepilin-type N-terminal cleavage/methylation domain-containing protein